MNPVTGRIPRLISFAICLVFVHAASAQWSNNAAINLPIADGGANQENPKVRGASDNSCFISWYGPGYDLYLQRLSRDGVEQWAHNGILLDAGSFSSSQDYDHKVDAGDNAVVVYRDNHTGSVQATAHKVSPAGTLLWGPTGVQVSTGALSPNTPRCAPLSDGNVVIGWTNSVTPSSITLQKLNSSGTPQWGPAGIVIADDQSPARPLTLCDLEDGGDGHVIALWVRCTGSNCVTSNKHLYTQKYNAAGAPVWGASPIPLLTTTSIQNGTFPPFLPDGAGGAIYAYYETGGSRNAYVQHVLSNGTVAFAAPGVPGNTTASRYCTSAGLSYDQASGETFLAWTQTNTGQSMYGVFAQRFSAFGERLWTDAAAQILALNSNQSSFVRSAAVGDGACDVVWLDARSATTAVVSGAQVQADGAVAWGGAPIAVCSRLTNKGRLDAIADRCGVAKVVWHEGTAGATDIFAQNVNRNGALGQPPPVAGDMNCNGVVDASDAPGFALAMIDPAAYAAQYACCQLANADMDADGIPDASDLQLFVDLVSP